MNTTKHYDLSLVTPDFDSELTNIILRINRFHYPSLTTGTNANESYEIEFLNNITPPPVFSQLKKFFHLLESVNSARIEGNNTTILDYLESMDDKGIEENENIIEIQNISECLEIIEGEGEAILINRIFISEIHKRVVKDLIREGSRNPGEYRKQNISISGSGHTPPDFTRVADYMDELFTFINEKHHEKYNLIKVAIAHHRFTWVHPFDNGNGRTVRLLTYAMLMQQGFFVGKEKIINPTAIFCMDREKYYSELSKADTGAKQGMIRWCEYMLVGLKKGIEEVHLILNNDFDGQSGSWNVT